MAAGQGSMNFKVLGLSAWGRGFTSPAELAALVDGGDATEAEFVVPKPEAISSRERRRAGLLINLAVMVAHQACEDGRVNKAEVPSVFVSAMGDTDITDYMCRKLAQPEKMLSPTKFHNSVHNAPSGYWSISAENRSPSTFVGAAQHSFGAGLLEAVSQANGADGPVLLVGYDIANKLPFSDVFAIAEHLACALVVAPEGFAAQSSQQAVDVSLEFAAGDAPEPQPPETPALAAIARANPQGVGLALIEKLLQARNGRLDMPVGYTLPAARSLALQLSIQPVATVD